MKVLLFLSLLISGCTVAYAQPPEYFVDTWYLHAFTFNNSTVLISDLEIPDGPTLVIENDYSLHGTGFCNTYTGFYEYINNDPFGVDDNFIPRNVVRDTQYCGDMEEMETAFLFRSWRKKLLISMSLMLREMRNGSFWPISRTTDIRSTKIFLPWA